MFRIIVLFLTFFSCILAENILIGGNIKPSNPILEMFKRKKVTFITAGADFPERDAELTNEFFRRVGITAKWIPMFSPCVDKVKDPKLVKMVMDSDYVYIGTGISEKLQYCLLGDSTNGTNPFIEALQKKNVVGMSSGILILPSKNIFYTRSSTDSYDAVVNGRIESFGENGIGVFKNRIVDAHATERQRQGRLFVFAVQTRTKLAFGIDENTAIIEKANGDIHVTGEKGVYIFENTKDSFQDGLFHYLTEGDIYKKDGRIQYATWKRSCDNLNEVPRPSTSIFAQFRNVSIDLARYKERVNYVGTTGRNPVVEVVLKRLENSKTVCGKRSNIEYVSFNHMFVSMSKK